MGSVFKNATIYQSRPASTKRQKRYFQARKTDRPRVVKHEQQLQTDICQWIKDVLPGVHFRSDTGSGAFNSKHEKEIHNKQQSGTSEPDLMIFAARHGYHGLLIELKADGTNLRMGRDGRTIRVYKDGKGRIIDRDYKIRKKGDWASLHIERQADTLLDYEKNWQYCARFAVGEAHAKKLICWYFDLEYVENGTLF
ncbi:MAG TPA: hypothetical protein VH234_04975 [Candidatus Saccharimonadales bacterium]|jgi:hypothetical protein|nr:hypothetical protein [Candidatus Saccharimonadales bacterium]